MPSNDNGNGDNDFIDMSLADIALQCYQDTQDWFPEHAQDLGYMAICLAGEVGEFANLIKKGMRGTHDPNDDGYRQEIAFELTDIFIYVMNTAAQMGLDMEKMYQVKRKYNLERFGQNTGPTGIIQP